MEEQKKGETKFLKIVLMVTVPIAVLLIFIGYTKYQQYSRIADNAEHITNVVKEAAPSSEELKVKSVEVEEAVKIGATKVAAFLDSYKGKDIKVDYEEKTIEIKETDSEDKVPNSQD